MKPSNAVYILILGVLGWVVVIGLIAAVTWIIGALLHLKGA
jgi:hypothetical protein